MALGRKGLTVCCFTLCAVCVLYCMHTALYGSAMQSHTKQSAGADRGENCIVLRTLHTWNCKITYIYT
ncbi:unnamed protein product [Staurois parvus]|uniref:Secreted protein n=1 Tax=Staurois parvus TaxID=386267 RepID=A0ABN9CT93_9NEOB|nr:unnamed protein product [Staurois parvus]